MKQSQITVAAQGANCRPDGEVLFNAPGQSFGDASQPDIHDVWSAAYVVWADIMGRRRAAVAGLLAGSIAALSVTACGGGGGTANNPTIAIAVPVIASPTPVVTPQPPSMGQGPMIGGCEVFPVTAVFNTRIDDLARFPTHASSAIWISNIGSSRALHMDFGSNDNQLNASTYYGIPYNVVDGTAATTAWPSVSFDLNGGGWPDESHCAKPDATHSIAQCSTQLAADRRFPFPNADIIKTESGACNDPASCGDRHVLVVEQGACRLWESYFSYKTNTQWAALATAAWDMKTNMMRPASWTSSDAAGLPVLPLLMRADEATAGEIRHAFRVTFRDSVLAKSYVWPARHAAGGETAGGIPFGALLRLKSDFDIPATWSVQSKAVARAMQRHGAYVADIGSDAYFTGDPNAKWSAATLSELQRITMGSFEFVNIGAITTSPNFNANSFQAAW